MSALRAQRRAEAADAIIADLDLNPEDWVWGDVDTKLTLRHKKSRLALWVARGSSVHIYEPHKVQFGFWQRRKLRRAYNRWVDRVGNGLARAVEHEALAYVLEVLA